MQLVHCAGWEPGLSCFTRSLAKNSTCSWRSISLMISKLLNVQFFRFRFLSSPAGFSCLFNATWIVLLLCLRRAADFVKNKVCILFIRIGSGYPTAWVTVHRQELSEKKGYLIGIQRSLAYLEHEGHGLMYAEAIRVHRWINHACKAVAPNLFGTRDWFPGRPFSHGPGGGDGFKMIQVYHLYCTLYFYYYYISSTLYHQALDLRGWGSLP